MATINVKTTTAVSTPRAERFLFVQIKRKNNNKLGKALIAINEENIPVKLM
jgi:hypothetical protein